VVILSEKGLAIHIQLCPLWQVGQKYRIALHHHTISSMSFEHYSLSSLSSALADFRFSFFSFFSFFLRFRSARSSGVSPSCFLRFLSAFTSEASPFVFGALDSTPTVSAVSPFGATGAADDTSDFDVCSAAGAEGPSAAAGGAAL